jgi:three-Cys-motif partner protein
MTRPPATLGDHAFGSDSTDLKLGVLEQYLKAYTTALRSQFRELWFIDAFAGTGNRTIIHEAVEGGIFGESAPQRVEQRRGSARIALGVEPAFDRLVFIDLKPSHYRALCALRDEHPERNIEVLRGDANQMIREAIAGQSWTGIRAVMFIDPYGMHLEWSTLEAIKQTGAIDVWYLVSLEGLFRQAARDRSKLTDYKRAKITAMVGATDWEDEWYPAESEGSLFDLLSDPPQAEGPGGRRCADVAAIETYFLRRLRSLFPMVEKPLRLTNKGGVQTFALFFAISNTSPKAMGLAKRLAGHILNSGKASQVRRR